MWKCSKCSENLEDEFDSCWNCGTNKDGSLGEKQPEGTSEIESDEAHQSRIPGSILVTFGVLLIVFGAVRWNSISSQFQRQFGQTDSLAILLFIGGAIALLKGFARGLTTSAPGSDSTIRPAANNSVEERLRQLEGLRAKQLISDAEYAERREDILASL